MNNKQSIIMLTTFFSLLGFVTQIPALSSVHLFFLLLGAMLLGGLATFFILQDKMERNSQLFNKDPITGLHSSAVLKGLLSYDIEKAKRFKQPISLGIFEIDGFSTLFQNLKKKECDELLKHLSNIIVNGARYIHEGKNKEYYGTRKSDIAFSCLKDSKILLVMPETNLQGSKIVAERIREAVMHTACEMGSNQDKFVSITVSSSLVSYDFDADTPDNFIERGLELLQTVQNESAVNCIVTESNKEEEPLYMDTVATSA